MSVSIKTAQGGKIVVELVADKAAMDAAVPSASGKNKTVCFEKQKVVVNGIPVTVQITAYIPNRG